MKRLRYLRSVKATDCMKKLFPGKYKKTVRLPMSRMTAAALAAAYAQASVLAVSGRCMLTMRPWPVTKVLCQWLG